jgi:hypothetical protein
MGFCPLNILISARFFTGVGFKKYLNSPSKTDRQDIKKGDRRNQYFTPAPFSL